jgi:hypothetical protein
MEIFKGQNLIEFTERFASDQYYREYLSNIKWSEQYVCRKCSHTKSQIRKDYARTCNICGDTESAMANILFHKVKFALRKAFFICFEMATTTKSLSVSQMAVRFGVQEKTARIFMQKVREAMKSSQFFPMKGIVNVDEYVVGGYEEGRPGRVHDELHLLKKHNKFD